MHSYYLQLDDTMFMPHYYSLKCISTARWLGNTPLVTHAHLLPTSRGSSKLPPRSYVCFTPQG